LPLTCGYGKSDRPEAIDQYTIFHLVSDLVGLLDGLEAPRPSSSAMIGARQSPGRPHVWSGLFPRNRQPQRAIPAAQSGTPDQPDAANG
jgi:hypothetical protein